MKIYLAGPMTGFPEQNFPAFDEARDTLLARGFEVVSPADLNRSLGVKTYKEYLRYDLQHLLSCDAIYLMEGWKGSPGAKVEFCVATAIGLTLFFQVR